MKNFLEETKKALAGKPRIKFIGSSDEEYSCTWGQFCTLADFEYDSGYGCQEIASDLVIVFEGGGWLSRQAYYGSEWWHHNKVPVKKSNPITITNLKSNLWEDINNPKEV